MSKAKSHIIEKQFVEVEVKGMADPFDFRNELTEFCKDRLLPEIEKLFDREIPSDKFIRIDKLEIDAGDIFGSDWMNKFIDNVIVRLSIEIEAMHSSASRGVKAIHPERDEVDADAILYFIEFGSLPWYAHEMGNAEIAQAFKVMTAKRMHVERIRRLMKNATAVRRIVHQFDKEQIEELISGLIPQIDIGKIIKSIGSFGIHLPDIAEIVYTPVLESAAAYGDISKEKFREQLTQQIILQLKQYPEYSSDRAADDVAKAILQSIATSVENAEQLFTESEDIKIPDENTSKEKYSPDVSQWYISNSGLVILHPFVTTLFERTGYIEDKNWIEARRQQRAIALLQYAVTGTDEFPEFLLMLNKIICGYEISDTLPSNTILSEFEKNETDRMLAAVISHWTALKNTSINGLRENFLKRKGKLTKKEDGWLLQVEDKTADILINRMPWGMSYIKLPWMKQMLRVEWNY